MKCIDGNKEIVVAVLIGLVILTCIGYCVYKKCSAKKNDGGNGQQYSGVPTRPSTVP